MDVPQVKLAFRNNAPTDIDAAVVRVAAKVLAIRPCTRVGEEFSLGAVYVQEGFLLAFTKDKVGNGFATELNGQTFAGGLGVGGGLYGPVGLGIKGN